MLASVAVATVAYAVIGTGVVVLASTQPPPEQEKELEVSFEKTLPKKTPPPPPPAKVEQKRVERPKVPVPPKEVIVPKEIPQEKPPEVDPSTKPDFGSSGVEGGVVGGTGSAEPPPPPPPPPPKKPEPVNLPEEAEPPVPNEANAQPVYPEDARATGKEAEVILKVVITETGKVTAIQLMRGEEPFVAAAMAAVKSWTYDPAKLDGSPIAVYKIIKLRFRLSG